MTARTRAAVSATSGDTNGVYFEPLAPAKPSPGTLQASRPDRILRGQGRRGKQFNRQHRRRTPVVEAPLEP